jgi:hypothetical protein
MPSPKTIADIKLNLLRPALTSHFEVKIVTPSGLTPKYLSANGIQYNQSKLNLLCSDAILPGSQLATHSISGDFHGATHKHAYRRQYDDRIDLSFYVDAENYLPIRFFEAWIKYISGEQITPAAGRPGTQKSEYFYRMNYPKDYICNSGFEVIKFERDYKQQMVYNFVDVFPISINSMSVSYDASSLLKCTVGFSYVRYFINPATPPGPENQSSTTGAADSPQALTGAGGLTGAQLDAIDAQDILNTEALALQNAQFGTSSTIPPIF